MLFRSIENGERHAEGERWRTGLLALCARTAFVDCESTNEETSGKPQAARGRTGMKFAQHCNSAVGPRLKIFSRIHAIGEPELSAGRGGVPLGSNFRILRESFGQFLRDRHFIRVRVGLEGNFDTLAGNQSQRSELSLTDHETRSDGAVRHQSAGKTGSANFNLQPGAGPKEIRRDVRRHRR